MKTWVLSLFSGLCALTLTGCTAMLWSGEFSSPAQNPGLKLYGTPHGTLAQYNEVDEACDARRRRSYFVEANPKVAEGYGKPQFVEVAKDAILEPIPLFSPPPTNNLTNAVYATSISTNGDPFVLWFDGTQYGPYALPAYRHIGSRGLYKKILLTPVALVGDCCLVGFLVATECAKSSSHDSDWARDQGLKKQAQSEKHKK